MLTLAHLQQRRSRRWLLGLTLLLLVTPADQPVRGGAMDPARRVALAPKVSCLSGRSACREPWRCCWWGRRWRSPGAIMQALFENPLAEPGLLGVSNGAGVGLIAAVLLGKGVLPGWAASACVPSLARC